MLYSNSTHAAYSQHSPSNRSYSPSCSLSHKQSAAHLQTYVTKLQKNIKQLSKIVRSKRPVIEQLECKRKFYKQICDKQKEKLSMTNVQMIKEQYEMEIGELRENKARLQEMVHNIHQEYQYVSLNKEKIKISLQQNAEFLSTSLVELNKENQQYRELLLKKKETIWNQHQAIQSNKKTIAEKQKIEEKYRLVCQEISRKEKIL